MKDLQQLVNEINDTKMTLTDYIFILDIATNQKEMATVVFLYDHMIKNNIKPDEQIFKLIDRLHSKTIPENNTISLQLEPGKRLQPRRRIHKIMKGHNYTGKYDNAKQFVQDASQIILNNPSFKYYHKIKLAKIISKELKIDMNIAKVVVTALKRKGLVSSTEDPSKFKDLKTIFTEPKNISFGTTPIQSSLEYSKTTPKIIKTCLPTIKQPNHFIKTIDNFRPAKTLTKTRTIDSYFKLF
jgi:hypothetical protein